MHAHKRAKLRAWALPIILFILVTLTFHHSIYAPSYAANAPLRDDSPRLHDQHHTLHFTEAECRRIFPKLVTQLDEAQTQGPFELPFRNRVVLQGKIENGEVRSWEIEEPPLHPLEEMPDC